VKRWRCGGATWTSTDGPFASSARSPSGARSSPRRRRQHELCRSLFRWLRRSRHGVGTFERASTKAKVPLPAYVFPSRSRELLQPKPIGRRFSALLRKANLASSLTLYSLRHTFASQLLDQGVKPEVVAKLLGHENVTTTYQFYAHAIPADDTLSIG